MTVASRADSLLERIRDIIYKKMRLDEALADFEAETGVAVDVNSAKFVHICSGLIEPLEAYTAEDNVVLHAALTKKEWSQCLQSR